MTKEIEEKEEEPKPEYTFDLSEMEVSNKISDLHQEGNYLVGITDKGVKFRQHIPQGKILGKLGDKWILRDMNCNKTNRFGEIVEVIG